MVTKDKSLRCILCNLELYAYIAVLQKELLDLVLYSASRFSLSLFTYKYQKRKVISLKIQNFLALLVFKKTDMSLSQYTHILLIFSVYLC